MFGHFGEIFINKVDFGRTLQYVVFILLNLFGQIKFLTEKTKKREKI
jgi:hypothetical protein